MGNKDKVEEKTKTADKGEGKKKAAEPKKNLITTKSLADKVGAKPAAIRRYLRTIKTFQDGTYTRYKWDPENAKDAQFLKDFEAGWEKHKVAEKEKNKKRLEDLKAKGKDKKAEAKGKKKEEPEEEAEEEEEVEEEPEEETEDEEELG